MAVPWYAAMRWQDSPEAARAERNADAPTPIWLTPTPPPVASSGANRSAGRYPAAGRAQSLSVQTAPTTPSTAQPVVFAPPQLSTPIALNANIAVAPTATPSISVLKLTDSAFTFDDAPEPGAHVRLTLTVHNPTDAAIGPVTVGLPTTWLPGYKLETTSPELVNGAQESGMLRLSFDGPDAGRRPRHLTQLRDHRRSHRLAEPHRP